MPTQILTINTTRIFDADGDTGIKSEPTADLDRLDLFAASSGGAENAIEVTGDDSSAASLNNPYIKVLKHIVLDTDVRIQDAVSGNTYIEMTDTGNADIIFFNAGGVNALEIHSTDIVPQVDLQMMDSNTEAAKSRKIGDGDMDTYIDFNNSTSGTDDDVIRLYSRGNKVMSFHPTFAEAHMNLIMFDASATAVGKRISDQDSDTYIVFNEATGGTDDDTIRMYANGTEVVNVTSSGLSLVVAGANFGTSGNLGAGVTSFPTGGDKGVNIAEGTRPTATNLNNDEVFMTAVANVGYSGQSDLYIDFKDGASSKKTVILGEDCTFPNDVNISNDLIVSNGVAITGTLSFDGTTFATDIITEKTSDTGVTIDGFLIKDNAPDPSVWPSFHVHKNGTDQLDVGTALTLVTWSDEEFDTNNDFDSNRWTPTVKGKYLLSLQLTIKSQSGSTSEILKMSVYKGGVEYKTNSMHVSSTTVDVTHSMTIVVDVSDTLGTDYYEVFFANTVTATRGDIEGDAILTHWSGCRIG